MIKSNGTTRIVQNGRTLITLGGGSTVKGLSLSCPAGHKVKVDRYLQETAEVASE